MRAGKDAIIAVPGWFPALAEPAFTAAETNGMHTQNDEEIPVSKTRRKRDMEELQDLGEELAGLPADWIRKIELPESLRDALNEVRRMPRHDEARRRQMQFIGKLMRSADIEPIRAALALARGESASETARLHRLEKLRDDVLADEKALQSVLALYPGADLQYLRSLRRSALKEREQEKPPRSYRALFQVLKELDGREVGEQSAHGDSPDPSGDQRASSEI